MKVSLGRSSARSICSIFPLCIKMALHSKTPKSRQYPAKTITDVDYADDIALLSNTPTQAESLLHSMERAAGDISLNVNADKT